MSGRAVWKGYNDLATTNPDLAREWHSTKNKGLFPYDVTSGSSRKVWWHFPYDDPVTGKHYDFEWQASVYNRNSGQMCPFLTGHAVWGGYNDLFTKNPELAKECHSYRNGDLSPNMVASGSSRKVWWYLPYDDLATGKHFDFEWQAYVAHRVQGIGCPFISNQAVWKGFNDLATTNPNLAAEWHPSKNGALTPADVTAGSDLKVWWLLPYDDVTTGKHFDFEWQVRIADRAHGDGCPLLSGKALWQGYNDLETLYPEIAKEWHPTKNKNFTPRDIQPGSEIKVWWLCSNGHEWKANPGVRKNGSGCPICSESKGEKKVRSILEKRNIAFKPLFSFDELKNIKSLRCDFALFNSLNQIIAVVEYNGEQHYGPVDFAGKGDKWAEREYSHNLERDKKKKEFLEKKNIPLLTIPYWEYDNIDTIVAQFIDKLCNN